MGIILENCNNILLTGRFFTAKLKQNIFNYYMKFRHQLYTLCYGTFACWIYWRYSSSILSYEISLLKQIQTDRRKLFTNCTLIGTCFTYFDVLSLFLEWCTQIKGTVTLLIGRKLKLVNCAENRNFVFKQSYVFYVLILYFKTSINYLHV